MAGWHSDTYQLLGITPSPVPRAAVLMDDWERWSEYRLPAAIKEWYSVPDAAECLARRRDNLLVPAARLGEPVDRIDYLTRGLLVTETDSQGCCRWAVRLEPPQSRYRQEPLFELPSPDTTVQIGDDPPVWIVDADDSEAPLERYSDTFSAYVLTCAWDARIWAGNPAVVFDHPLPPGAIDTLRRDCTELPTTYAWAGNQPCDAMYRFDGPAQILVAVAGGRSAYSVVKTDNQQRRARVLSILCGIHD